MDDAEKILRLIGAKTQVRVLIGTFVGLSGSRVLIDVGGGRIPAQSATAWRPRINDDVTVVFIDETPYLWGPSTPLAAEGTVVSVASSLVTLTTDMGPVVATYPLGATLTAGQQVKLFWSNGPHVISVMSTTPVAPTPPPAPGGGGGPHQQTFTAIDSGSYGSRWFTGQVYASASNLGAFFFGTKIPDTIPAAATITGVEMYISPVQISGSAPNVAVHAHAGKPGGAPSLSTVAAVGIGAGWVGLPISVGNALKAGGGALGVGFNHGGFSIMRDLGADGLSGALRISWTS